MKIKISSEMVCGSPSGFYWAAAGPPLAADLLGLIGMRTAIFLSEVKILLGWSSPKVKLE
jgi:hypothetical protein